MTLGVACLLIRQDDETVNSGSSKCFNGALIKCADRCNRDFEVPEFGWAGVLIGGPTQALDVLLCLLDGKAKTVPAIA